MKKIILCIVCVFMLVGCKKNDDNNIINELNKKILSASNYQLIANLDIYRNEEKFSYDVISTYQKGDKFKVELTNKQNNHKQIILKNVDSVYVLTPSLNKSFKFKSDWPYNNSQIYLLQPIISDIEFDKERMFESKDNNYIITSKVNYSSEPNLQKQKVYFNNNKEIVKVEVIDKDDEVKMRLEIVSINYNIDIDDNYFKVESHQEEPKEEFKNEKSSESYNLYEIVYPMYVPIDTHLTSQDVVETEEGERVILTFSGDSQFILIQENLINNQSEKYVYGDPYLILDTIGSITDSSVSWISNGIEYSVMSDTMSVDKLLTVAQSISVQPVGK